MAKKPKIQTRKPPRAAGMEQFIGGRQEAPPVGVGPQGGSTTRRMVRTGEFKGQLEARVTVTIPEELLTKAKVWCVTNRTSLSAVVIDALRSRVG